MIFDSDADLLPGLLPASYRGVPFSVPDASSEVGRRVRQYLFPGLDDGAYDDFGQRPDVISISGVLIGEDYVSQAVALEQAFKTAGMGTLVHPWLGPMTVIMEEPGQISFADTELRVARFSATFKRPPSTTIEAGLSTAAGLLSTALSAIAALVDLGRASDSITTSSVSSAAAASSDRVLRSAWLALPAGEASAAIAAALGTVDTASGQAFAARVAGVTDAVVRLVPGQNGRPAVSPSAELQNVGPSLSAAASIDLLLTAASAVLAVIDDAPSDFDRALLAIAGSLPVVRAARLTAFVGFQSRNEATALRLRLCAALDAGFQAMLPLGGGRLGGAARQAGNALLALKTAAIEDLNEVIGRLPPLLVLTVDHDVDAWDVANHIYGDDPLRIEAGYAELVVRNRPRHPARLPAGRIEARR